MPLVTVLDSLEGLPEALQPLYKQRVTDQKFVLDVDGDADDLYPGLAASKQKILEEKKALAARLEAKEREDAERAESETKKRAQAEGDFAAIERQLIEKHSKELNAKAARVELLERTIERQLVEREALSEIMAAGGKAKPLMALVREVAKVVYDADTGEPTVRIVSPEGSIRIGEVRSGVAVPMTLKQLIDEFREDPDLKGSFAAQKQGGGGAPPEQSRVSPPRGQDLTKLSAIERMKIARRK